MLGRGSAAGRDGANAAIRNRPVVVEGHRIARSPFARAAENRGHSRRLRIDCQTRSAPAWPDLRLVRQWRIVRHAVYRDAGLYAGRRRTPGGRAVPVLATGAPPETATRRSDPPKWWTAEGALVADGHGQARRRPDHLLLGRGK